MALLAGAGVTQHVFPLDDLLALTREGRVGGAEGALGLVELVPCLLYTSDAADE